jgi:ribosomal protein L3 glutamine methyltransferase
LILNEIIEKITDEFDNSDIFFGHGALSAIDEAVWLVSSVLKIKFKDINKHLNNTVSDEDANKINLIKTMRIEQRIPLAYLLNEAWLKDVEFYIDERALIPRSLIADLIEDDFYPWIESIHNINSVLDLCCGSGCLGILLAKSYPHLDVDLIDISQHALEVARINIEKHNLQKRVAAIQSNLFEHCQKKYDLIVTNPPYVNANAMTKLPSEYQKEPQLALASGEDGLDLTRIIIKNAKKYLNDNGKIFIEIGHNRDVVDEVFRDLNLWWVDTESGSDYIFMLEKNDLP